MSTIAVLGAHGFTGRHVVEQLERRGDRVIQLDLEQRTADELVMMLLGTDAVVYAATPEDAGDSSIASVEAAEIAGVKRYVQVTSVDTYPSERLAAVRLAADRNLRASSLDWTILEPVERADAAAAVIASLDDARTVGHAWEITDGATPPD